MKVAAFVAIAGAVTVMAASAADALSDIKTSYSNACISEGMRAEIESARKCGKRDDEVKCYSFEHSKCLTSRTGDHPTGAAYFVGLLLALGGVASFTVMWMGQKGREHEQAMKALG